MFKALVRGLERGFGQTFAERVALRVGRMRTVVRRGSRTNFDLHDGEPVDDFKALRGEGRFRFDD